MSSSSGLLEFLYILYQEVYVYMKTQFFKFLSLSVLAAFLLSLMGCDSVKEEDEFIPESTVVLEDLKPVSLSFCFPGVQPKNWPEVKEEIEKRAGPTLHVSLDFKWLDSFNYSQRLRTQSASDSLYDAFVCAQPDQYTFDFTVLAREGKLKDITELFPKNAPDLYAKYSSEELDYAKLDGRLYAVPSLNPQANCTYVYVNAELLKKYNIDKIETFDDYEKYLKAVKNGSQKLIPGIVTNMSDTLRLFSRASGYVIADSLQWFVYKWDDPEMKVVPWEKTPEFRKAVSYLVSWYKNGYLAPSSNTDFKNITSFVYYGLLSPPSIETTYMTFSVTGGNTEKSDPMRIFYLYPDNTVQRENPMGTFFFNGSFVFDARSENTDRALRFLDWVQKSRENYMLMLYGIENKDYVIRDGSPVFPDGMDYQNRTYMYWDGYWAFTNIEYSTPYSAPGGNAAANPREFLDKNSKYPPHGALYPNYDKLVIATMERNEAYTHFEDSLREGDITNMAQVDAFIKELEEKGSANLAALLQKQLDEKKGK